MELRTRIRRWMEIKKIRSVNALASRASLTQSTLNNIMSGRSLSATTSTIDKICAGLDITVNEFWELPDSINNYLSGTTPNLHRLSAIEIQRFYEDQAKIMPPPLEISHANIGSNVTCGDGEPPFKKFGAIIDRAIEAGITPEELEEGLDYILFIKQQKQIRKGDSQ